MTNGTILSPEDIAAGWRVHDGKGMPVAPSVEVEVRYHGRDTPRMRHRDIAGSWEACWKAPMNGISAYRVVQPVAKVDAPAPRAPRSPLLTVAPIPKTGFSLWGADHG